MWLRQLWAHHHYEGETALAISHSEVDRALLPYGRLRAAEVAFYSEDSAAAELSASLESLSATPADGPWRRLLAAFEVPEAETHLLALCLAAAADPAMSRVFGYLLDLPSSANATPALASALFGLPPGWSPSPDGALARWQLARPVADGLDPCSCATGWEADGLLLAPMLAPRLAEEAPDWSTGSISSVQAAPIDLVLRPALVDEIVSFVRSVSTPLGPGVEIELLGAAGSGRKMLAAAVAGELEPAHELLVVPGQRIAGAPDVRKAVVTELRRSVVEERPVLWEHAEEIPAQVWEHVGSARVSFISCRTEVPHPPTAGSVRRSFRVPDLTRGDRLRLWSTLAPEAEPPAPVSDWDLRPGEIVAAWRALAAGKAAVREVCRRLLLATTPELLTPMPLPYTWGDLVVSPRTESHLRELEAQARDRPEVLDGWGLARLTAMGRGVTALFAGPSGTGKTMAAQVLARSLDLDLYRVDLAGLVSKYIGETEKHLREVFDACERAPVLLLFDEADALFGKRSEVNDAHDRYANIEIDYILQRMETFNGTAILATNRKGDLDSAFVRRIQFIVDFFPPSPGEREHLWRLALEGSRSPDGVPLTGGVDWDMLSERYDLTGAGIKSAALASAFLARSDGARIDMPHLLAAVRRELEKAGKVMRPAEANSRGSGGAVGVVGGNRT
jgi:hypothetical protein